MFPILCTKYAPYFSHSMPILCPKNQYKSTQNPNGQNRTNSCAILCPIYDQKININIYKTIMGKNRTILCPKYAPCFSHSMTNLCTIFFPSFLSIKKAGIQDISCTPTLFTYSQLLLKSTSLKSDCKPDNCLSLNNSSASIPMFFIIHASDIPDSVSSATMFVMSSILCSPLARL